MIDQNLLDCILEKTKDNIMWNAKLFLANVKNIVVNRMENSGRNALNEPEVEYCSGENESEASANARAGINKSWSEFDNECMVIIDKMLEDLACKNFV